MSNTQIAVKGRDLQTRLENFERDIEKNPSLSDAEKQRAFDLLKKDYEAWEADSKRNESAKSFLKKMGGSPADLGSAPDVSNYQLGAKGLGKDVCPFGLPKSEVSKAYEAVKRGGNYIIDTARDHGPILQAAGGLPVAGPRVRAFADVQYFEL